MSLKAGRVGVNPADVDPIDGHISPSSVDSYTKAQSDAKFETQTHAELTYETKSDAAALQPIRLSVPIELLHGSVLTVEEALNGLNEEQQVSAGACSDFVEGSTLNIDVGNHLIKQGEVVFMQLGLDSVTCTAWTGYIAMVPEAYRPKFNVFFKDNATGSIGVIQSNGRVQMGTSLTAQNVKITTSWIIK